MMDRSAPRAQVASCHPDLMVRAEPRGSKCHLTSEVGTELLGVSSIAKSFSQRVSPNKAPTPAVSAIASAPQKVTRATDLHTGEPPARAAKVPSSARKNNEL